MNNSKKYNCIYLNEKRRESTLESIKSTCKHYGWRLYAAHVRSNHVHAVVRAQKKPEFVLNQIKSYATRHLKKCDGTHVVSRYWSRHGSTRYIWSSVFIYPAIQYVVDRQGKQMACWYESWYDNVSIFDF